MRIKSIKLIIKIALLFVVSYLSYKLTLDLYILSLVGLMFVLLFFFKYKEIFIISIALVIGCFILYLFNIPIFYEKIGEYLFITLISGFILLFSELRKTDD